MSLADTIRSRVLAQAMPWEGTPYHHHGRLQGVGVDCAMLLAEVFHAAGLAPSIQPGAYPVDWHLHRNEELFLTWVARAGGREVDAPGLADVGIFRFGRTYSHGAIVIDHQAGHLQLLHAHIDVGRVVRCGLDEAPLCGRAVRWFTLIPEV